MDGFLASGLVHEVHHPHVFALLTLVFSVGVRPIAVVTPQSHPFLHTAVIIESLDLLFPP